MICKILSVPERQFFPTQYSDLRNSHIVNWAAKALQSPSEMPSCTLPEEDKASPKAGGQDANDVDDPVVATYSVFIKPPLPDNRELLILQYVNKTSQDPAHIRPPRISELRVKPKTGMFEVDVAVDTSQAYDQAKGIKWGTALRKSMETRKGGSLGLAGGFGIGGAGPRGAPPGGRRGANSEDAAPLTWQEATRQDKVLRAQTLGGGRGAEEQTANYMVGVFQGSESSASVPRNMEELLLTARCYRKYSSNARILTRPPPPGPSSHRRGNRTGPTLPPSAGRCGGRWCG